MSLILITGGARAGKSTFAAQLAQQLGGECGVCYLATAEPGDDEMRERIAAHRAARPAEWRTLEVPRGLGPVLRGLTPPARPGVVVLDCMTMLVSNVLLAQTDQSDAVVDAWPAVEAEVSELLHFAAHPDVTTIVITNEVGLGIVPVNRLARVYRDLLGRANQYLASAADFFYLVVSGIPLEIKEMYRPFTQQMGDRE
jgi:adenosylcobinamide kinase/adenosylcobinamide-phosphate guanylyltransferase